LTIFTMLLTQGGLPPVVLFHLGLCGAGCPATSLHFLSEREIIEPNNNLIALLKAGVATEIALKKTLIWDTDRFAKLKLTCSDEFFFEALASNIKGSVISFQTFTKRLANLKQSRLVQRLNVLKENYICNQEEIGTLEQELNSIVNSEVLLKVKSMKLFSCLNSEKPTRIFLSLA
jgi:hypothetical protein